MWQKEYEWVRRVKMWLKDGCDEARIFVYIREGRRAIVTTAVLLALLIQFGCWCVFDSCSSQCNKVWYYKLRETDECEWWIWVRQPAVGSASMWEGARGGGEHRSAPHSQLFAYLASAVFFIRMLCAFIHNLCLSDIRSTYRGSI